MKFLLDLIAWLTLLAVTGWGLALIAHLIYLLDKKLDGRHH